MSPVATDYLNRSSNALRALFRRCPTALPALLAARARLALDGRSRREQRAAVARVLGRDPRRHAGVLRALPPRRWCRTTRTECSCGDRRRTSGSESSWPTGNDSRLPQRAHRNTSCAAIRFGRLRAPLVLQHPPRRPFLRRRAASARWPSVRAARPDSRAAGTCGRSLLGLHQNCSQPASLAMCYVPGSSFFRNSARYLPQIAGSECVPWPRVWSLVGIRT